MVSDQLSNLQSIVIYTISFVGSPNVKGSYCYKANARVEGSEDLRFCRTDC